MSKRPFAIAACVAGVVLVVCWAIVVRGGRPAPEGGQATSASRAPGSSAATTGEASALGSGGATGAVRVADVSGSLDATSSTGDVGGRPGTRRDRARGRGAPGMGAALGSSENGGGSPGSGEGTEGSPREVLSGGALSGAVAAALETNDLGALQGLLISSLTMKGTRFTAEDVSMLFDALAATDDYGMEKLILTHLQRLDAVPGDKAIGYADYLVGSKNPAHAEEVFGELVRMGAEAAFGPLRDVYMAAPNDRLRNQAARALADLRDPRAVPLLSQGLYGAQDAAAARPYVDALARLGGPEALSSLIGYVSEEGNEAALSSLREIQDRDAAPLLAYELNRRSSEAYQRAALNRLRALPDPRALDDLARFLDRASGPIARETIDAVARIQDPAAVRVLERFAARQSDPALGALAGRAASRLRSRREAPTSPGTQARGDKRRL